MDTESLQRNALRHIIANCEGCELHALAVATGVSDDDVAPALKSLQEARIVEEVAGRWRVQVELTRFALVELARRNALA
jgi:DNA-binding IclR family transcriptional regulator